MLPVAGVMPQLLHPQVTLQLCFLGCVLLREAVTFFDIMSWALDGQLPFQELPHLSMQVATGELTIRLTAWRLHKQHPICKLKVLSL